MDSEDKLFKIKAWQDPLLQWDTPENASTMGHFEVSRNGVCLTRNRTQEIHLDRSLVQKWVVRNEAHVSLHNIAHWMAWNFYRLCYEPPRTLEKRDNKIEDEQETDLEWVVSHYMAYADSSCILPPIFIQADGERVTLSLDKGERPYDHDYVIYLDFEKSIVLSLDDFRKSVLMFLKTVDERLKENGITQSDFQVVYGELLEELSDEESYAYRRKEASLGYAPDEMPENLETEST